MIKIFQIFTLVIIIASCTNNKMFVDSQGNTYKTIQIGNQIWMNENLKFHVDSGSYCYDNSKQECDSMGALYIWQAALKADELIEGWHLPTKEEWHLLFENLGGDSAAYEYFVSKESDFYLQPSGVRISSGRYQAKKYGFVNYWSGSIADTSDVLAYSIAIMPSYKKISPHNYPIVNACNVRLIKD